MNVAKRGHLYHPIHSRRESLSSMNHSRRPWPFAVSLFLLVLAVYLLTTSGHINSIDMQEEVMVGQSMVHHAGFDIPWLPNRSWDLANLGVGGKVYAAHGLGMTLVLMPVVLLGDLVRSHSGLTPLLESIGFLPLATSLVMGIVGALTVVLFFIFECDLGISVRPALAAALLFAFASIHWPYAHDTFDAGTAELFVLLGVFGLHRWSQGARLWLAGSGAALGFAFLTHAEIVLLLPIALAFVLLTLRRESEPFIRALEWVVPIVGFGLLMGWFNWVRFGSPTNDGHRLDSATKLTTPLLIGIHGLLWSPGKSLILFSPLILVGLLGSPLMAKRWRPLVLMIYAMAVVFILFHAVLGNWAGDWAWGPRLLVPLTALLMLPIGFVLQRWFNLNLAVRALVVFLALAGLVVALLGVLIDYEAVLAVRPSYTTSSPYWSISGSQILLAARALNRSLHHLPPYPVLGHPTGGHMSPLDIWWVNYQVRHYHSGAALLAVFLLTAAAVGAAVSLYRSSRRVRSDPAEARPALR